MLSIDYDKHYEWNISVYQSSKKIHWKVRKVLEGKGKSLYHGMH